MWSIFWCSSLLGAADANNILAMTKVVVACLLAEMFLAEAAAVCAHHLLAMLTLQALRPECFTCEPLLALDAFLYTFMDTVHFLFYHCGKWWIGE